MVRPAPLAKGEPAALKADLQTVRERVGEIPDPEIPVITLAELGILRDVRATPSGQIRVTLTPTYSGCPATEAIRDDVMRTLRTLGHDDAEVSLSLSPAWTTDWITAEAREKLRAYGIAPPGARCAGDNAQVIQFHPAGASEDPCCPRCSSPNVSQVSEFGSTPCKSLWRCNTCAEPFDYFKPF